MLAEAATGCCRLADCRGKMNAERAVIKRKNRPAQ